MNKNRKEKGSLGCLSVKGGNNKGFGPQNGLSPQKTMPGTNPGIVLEANSKDKPRLWLNFYPLNQGFGGAGDSYQTQADQIRSRRDAVQTQFGTQFPSGDRLVI